MVKLAPLALLAVLAACQTAEPVPVDPDDARREAYLEAHPETSAEVMAAIPDGDLVKGMLIPELEASVGRVELRDTLTLWGHGPPPWALVRDMHVTFEGGGLFRAMGCP